MPFNLTKINLTSVFKSFTVISTFLFFGCSKKNLDTLPQNSSTSNAVRTDPRPNIVLILADDIGYEIPTYTGGESYSTPNLDLLAQNSLQFSECYTAPNCSPSRVMLMTGKYNFRNYIDWGIMDTTQYTIGNLMHNAGYATCISGKWQLDGGDAEIRKSGFDAYRVFLPFAPPTMDGENAENWYRFKNPHLYEKAAYLPDSATNGKYADDMFVDYIGKFIDSNIDRPFFVYYPMSLCHNPHTPTPDDKSYASWTPESHKTSLTNFPSMVKYMDKEIGRVMAKINSSGLGQNTIVIFLSDNGTFSRITSKWRGTTVTGGKGTSTEYGTHVPLLVKWPGHIIPGAVNNSLVDLTDLMPTLADMAGISVPVNYGTIDGFSFFPAFSNSLSFPRSTVFCQWQPYKGYYTTSPLKRWAQTDQYKLYDSINKSKFYNVFTDTLELYPIGNTTITQQERTIKNQLQQILNGMHN
jgi:arylsulfatase A